MFFANVLNKVVRKFKKSKAIMFVLFRNVDIDCHRLQEKLGGQIAFDVMMLDPSGI